MIRGRGQAAEVEGQTSPVHQAAQRTWNEQMSVAISDRNWWRSAAIMSLAVGIIGAAGMYHFGAENHVVPYVVNRDHANHEWAAHEADRMPPPDGALIQAHLEDWISRARSVIVDVPYETRLIHKVYDSVDQSSPAYTYLNAWYANHSPFKRAADLTVSVSHIIAQPGGGNTWDVWWQEDYQSRNGTPLPSQKFQAVITIRITPPTTEKAIRANPTGIFVRRLSWRELPR